MARNFTAVGSEIQVNINGPVDNFIGNAQFDPDVAVLTDGRFFVVYTHEFIAGDNDIIGQFVNPDGTTSGAPVEIQYVGGNQQEGAVAQRGSGAAIVVWHDVATSDEIHYSIISNIGGVGTETTILDGNPLFNPDVATLADGRSLVVAQQANGTSDIVFRLVDAAGAPVGAQAAVDDGAGGQFDPAVAAFGNNALVVYQDNQSGTNDIAARFFNGSSFGAEVIVADTGSLTDADVAALSDGRFVVVWENDDTDDVEGRLVDASGTPIGAVFTISNQGGDNEDVRVAALPGGGFIAMWENDGGNVPPEVNNNDDAILGRRFDGNGAPAGDLFLVNAGDPDDDQDNVAVAVDPATGQAFAAWEDDNAFVAPGDTDPVGVRGHAFLATIDVIDGTIGDDIIQTFSLGEPINGLSGDDTIFALAGDDIVHGGSGADLILGGLGDDQLFGEAGADRLKGEDGNDLLVGGLGTDVLIGGLLKDTFDFDAVNETKVGLLHDFIKGFSHAEHDKIDLDTIDADTTAGGNQDFHLIGAQAFHGIAGELRVAGGLVQGDTDGNGAANFEIRVTGLGTAVNGDFVL